MSDFERLQFYHMNFDRIIVDCEEKEVVELIYLHKEKKEGWCPKWLQVYIFIYKKEFNIILDQSVYYDEWCWIAKKKEQVELVLFLNTCYNVFDHLQERL